MTNSRLRFLALILGAATSSCAVAAQPPAPAMAPPFGDYGGPPLPPQPGFIGAGMPIPFPGPETGHGPGEAGFSPRAHCLDEIAREAGLRTYIAATLNLSAPQQVLWARVEQAAASGAETRRKACANLPMTAPVTPPPLPLLMMHEKEQLAARLAELMEIQPAIATVYDALSPEQRALLDPSRPARP